MISHPSNSQIIPPPHPIKRTISTATRPFSSTMSGGAGSDVSATSSTTRSNRMIKEFAEKGTSTRSAKSNSSHRKSLETDNYNSNNKCQNVQNITNISKHGVRSSDNNHYDVDLDEDDDDDDDDQLHSTTQGGRTVLCFEGDGSGCCDDEEEKIVVEHKSNTLGSPAPMTTISTTSQRANERETDGEGPSTRDTNKSQTSVQRNGSSSLTKTLYIVPTESTKNNTQPGHGSHVDSPPDAHSFALANTAVGYTRIISHNGTSSGASSIASTTGTANTAISAPTATTTTSMTTSSTFVSGNGINNTNQKSVNTTKPMLPPLQTTRIAPITTPQHQLNHVQIQRPLECDYELSPTPLYLAIEARQWSVVLEMLENDDNTSNEDDDERKSSNLSGGGRRTSSRSKKRPLYPMTARQQASCWVVRKERDGRLRWRLLPIHAAIIFDASAAVVEALIEAYPGSASQKDDQGMLPLHLAFRNITLLLTDTNNNNKKCTSTTNAKKVNTSNSSNLLNTSSEFDDYARPKPPSSFSSSSSSTAVNWLVVEELLTANPQAVFSRDRKGRTPLQGGLFAAQQALKHESKQKALNTPNQRKMAALKVLELYSQIVSAGEKNNWLKEYKQKSNQRLAALAEQHAYRLQEFQSDFIHEQQALHESYGQQIDELRSQIESLEQLNGSLQKELQQRSDQQQQEELALLEQHERDVLQQSTNNQRVFYIEQQQQQQASLIQSLREQNNSLKKQVEKLSSVCHHTAMALHQAAMEYDGSAKAMENEKSSSCLAMEDKHQPVCPSSSSNDSIAVIETLQNHDSQPFDNDASIIGPTASLSSPKSSEINVPDSTQQDDTRVPVNTLTETQPDLAFAEESSAQLDNDQLTTSVSFASNSAFSSKLSPVVVSGGNLNRSPSMTTQHRHQNSLSDDISVNSQHNHTTQSSSVSHSFPVQHLQHLITSDLEKSQFECYQQSNNLAVSSLGEDIQTSRRNSLSKSLSSTLPNTYHYGDTTTTSGSSVDTTTRLEHHLTQQEQESRDEEVHKEGMANVSTGRIMKHQAPEHSDNTSDIDNNTVQNCSSSVESVSFESLKKDIVQHIATDTSNCTTVASLFTSLNHHQSGSHQHQPQSQGGNNGGRRRYFPIITIRSDDEHEMINTTMTGAGMNYPMTNSSPCSLMASSGGSSVFPASVVTGVSCAAEGFAFITASEPCAITSNTAGGGKKSSDERSNYNNNHNSNHNNNHNTINHISKKKHHIYTRRNSNSSNGTNLAPNERKEHRLSSPDIRQVQHNHHHPQQQQQHQESITTVTLNVSPSCGNARSSSSSLLSGTSNITNCPNSHVCVVDDAGASTNSSNGNKISTSHSTITKGMTMPHSSLDKSSNLSKSSSPSTSTVGGGLNNTSTGINNKSGVGNCSRRNSGCTSGNILGGINSNNHNNGGNTTCGTLNNTINSKTNKTTNGGGSNSTRSLLDTEEEMDE